MICRIWICNTYMHKRGGSGCEGEFCEERGGGGLSNHR